MFKKIRSVFQSIANRVAEVVSKREVTEEDLRRVFSEVEVSLVESDVAYDALPLLYEELRKKLVGAKVSRFDSEEIMGLVRKALVDILSRVEPRYDLVEYVKLSGVRPFVIVFLGVNGVGKTTTIAKVASKFLKAGMKPVVVAADTFRAGAQEQLAIHAERLGVPFFRGKYGADPAAVARDALAFSARRGLDVVLVDTAGRMHVDVDLVEELRKIVRVVRPHLKILVLDALTGNDSVEQIRYFESAVGFDAVILTKMDADARGGCALTLSTLLQKPIVYVGVGQSYEDLELFRAEDIVKKILG
ncbi:MAG: signal recognition particle-docking protein FtsY [Sulfolobales archaeon]|nr:signal recognition particle-docking protein FtsY [Sulfolobales archaeon]MCX8208255.1 signal recognition particle-docking protein FtsY [Sulfolobales archaeon]MDW8010856.1 signal recognition particle-docking protein FtsY [Sulfolobales archaeon]